MMDALKVARCTAQTNKRVGSCDVTPRGARVAAYDIVSDI